MVLSISAPYISPLGKYSLKPLNDAPGLYGYILTICAILLSICGFIVPIPTSKYRIGQYLNS